MRQRIRVAPINFWQLFAACMIAAGCEERTGPSLSGRPASLVVVAGQSQTGVVGKELTEALRVRVLDAEGRPVRNQLVNFRVTSGGGSAFAGSALTTDSGTAVERWTLGTSTSEPQRLEARAVDQATAQPIVFGTFEATALPDVPSQIAKAGGDAQTGTAGAPLPDSLAVVVSDQHGNLVPSTSVTWHVSAGGGTISTTTTQTNSSGITRARWTLGDAAGTAHQVTASIGSTAAVVFDATAGLPGYALTSSGTPQVAQTITVSAQLTDVNGAPVARAGRTVTWRSTGVSGSFGSATSTTNADGFVSVSFTGGTIAGAVHISASDDFGAAGGPLSLTLQPGPASKLAFVQQPSNVGWRVYMNPGVQVAVQDQYGNTITSDNQQITLELAANPGSASLQGNTATPTQGMATFGSLLVDQPGAGYSLRASTAGGITSLASNGFNVSAIATVTSSDGALGIAVAGENVFLSTSEWRGRTVWRAPITGGSRSLIADPCPEKLPFGNGAGRIVASATQGAVLLMCASGATSSRTDVGRFTAAGNQIAMTFAGGGRPRDLASDGTYYYASAGSLTNDFGQVSITRVRASDGEALSLFSRAYTTRTTTNSVAPVMTVHGGYVYYHDTLDIARVPIGGGTPTVVVPGALVSQQAFNPLNSDGQFTLSSNWRKMAVANGRIYFVTPSGSLDSAPISGGAATPHVAVNPTAGNMVVDEGGFIYLNDAGTLRRIRLSDHSVATIVTNGTVVDIAVDSVGVYWTTQFGLVKKTPK